MHLVQWDIDGTLQMSLSEFRSRSQVNQDVIAKVAGFLQFKKILV